MLAGDRGRTETLRFRTAGGWTEAPASARAVGRIRRSRPDRQMRWARATEAAAARFQSDTAFGSVVDPAGPSWNLEPRWAWAGCGTGIVGLGGHGFRCPQESDGPAAPCAPGEWLPPAAGSIPIGSGLRLRASYLYDQGAVTWPDATRAAWSDRLAATGTWELEPCAPSALVEAGAVSPVQGLLPGGAGAPSGSRFATLNADLDIVVDLRRHPSCLAIVTFGLPNLVRRPGGGAGRDGATTMAVLHGAAGGDGGVVALVEETRGADGRQLFVLSTPEAAAARILDAWRQLDEEAPAAVSVEVFRPDPVRPARVQVTLTAGVARLSVDGQEWQRSLPEDQFPDLFFSAIEP